jgi:regulator of sigma E protease
VFEIIISLVAISIIIILHELGHYLTAKKFDVKVEEFGLGLPPRLYGKKIGETIWSLNWIPFGGFVRMYGEENEKGIGKNSKDSHRAFSAKPIWQRMLITVAGCVMFWIVAFAIFVFVFTVGTYVAIEDYKDDPNAIVQITEVKKDSPFQIAELQAGDLIKEACIKEKCIQINQIRRIETIFRENAGEEVTIEIKRGDREIRKEIVLDKDDPKIGIGLIRIEEQSFPFLEAIPMAGERTVNVTILIAEGLYGAVTNLIIGEDPGELAGPVKIVGIMGNRLDLGIPHFLSFLAFLTINLAILNLLPIPGLDGGRLAFLAYEGIVKKPFPQKIEGYLTIFFLLSLMGLMLIVTISEIHAIL